MAGVLPEARLHGLKQLEAGRQTSRHTAWKGHDKLRHRPITDPSSMVQDYYGRFLPQDKAALAAKILNSLWEAA